MISHYTYPNLKVFYYWFYIPQQSKNNEHCVSFFSHDPIISYFGIADHIKSKYWHILWIKSNNLRKKVKTIQTFNVKLTRVVVTEILSFAAVLFAFGPQVCIDRTIFTWLQNDTENLFTCPQSNWLTETQQHISGLRKQGCVTRDTVVALPLL